MMALEREKNKLVLEKCQTILAGLLKDEDNKYCVDCDAKSPRWASWNLGIFLCIRCAGIHRNLGVHISKVKSVNLDTWTPQQVACIQQMGNSRARAVYEANLQDNFRRPQTDSSLEQFIRAKYEAKKYIAREWVPPTLPNPSWDIEIEKQLKKKKEKKVVSGTIEFPAPVKSTTNNVKEISPKPLPKAPGGRNSSPGSISSKRSSGSTPVPSSKLEHTEKENISSGMLDLLSLDTPTSNGSCEKDGEDIFGDFLKAPSESKIERNSLNLDGSAKQENDFIQSEESNFFNQKLPDLPSEKLSKDSILALYSQPPPTHSQTPTMYGGGMYMSGSGIPLVPSGAPIGGVPVSGMPPSQQQTISAPAAQQQNMMFFQQTGVVPGVPPTFFPPGQNVGVGMYPIIPNNVQLSAANPFAQMQNQMGNLSLGGMMSLPPHPSPSLPMGNPLIRPNMNVVNVNGLSNNPAQSTTLSTNLWQ